MRLALRWDEDGNDVLFPLPDDGIVTIGRDGDCDIVLADATVSRRHAEIVVRDGQAWLHHVSETNATYLNGAIMIGEAPLHIGDEIWLPVRLIHVTHINWPLP